jgi:predicted kinase
VAQLFIAVVGHNSSGKTSVANKLANRLPLNRVSGDDFREFVHNHIPYFHNTDLSYPSKKYEELNPLTIMYRFEMSWILLQANQNVLYDGSGATRERREKYLAKARADFPYIKTVLLWTDLDEGTLLQRLADRDKKTGAQWSKQYHDLKKHLFEPPAEGEADVLLRYDQNNYDFIEKEIKALLES